MVLHCYRNNLTFRLKSIKMKELSRNLTASKRMHDMTNIQNHVSLDNMYANLPIYTICVSVYLMCIYVLLNTSIT